MKTLIYVLAPYMNGTKRLASALTECCDLEGGHEIMGQGPYGSMKELPWWIGHRPHVKSGYGPEEESHGQPGDGLVANFYFEWAEKRYKHAKRFDALYYAGRVHMALRKYLDGDGFFVDINCHLADFWPCFEISPSNGSMKQSTRFVHLIRDGRMWAQRAVEVYKSFTGDGMHYGAIQNPETLYPYRDPKWRHEAPIIQAYRYWNALHTWFMTSGAKTFRLESFSDNAVAKQMLMGLYPEATPEQVSSFCRTLERGSESELLPYDEAAFEEICGDTMRKAGYKWA